MPCAPRLTASQTGFTVMEVLVALAVVAIGFAGLYATYSSSLKLIGVQQDMIAATLCLEERLDEVRARGLPAITTASRLRGEVLGAASKSGAGLPALAEQITVSVYPPPATGPLPTPIQVQRTAGVTKIISDPGNALASNSLVRVDVRVSWRRAGRQLSREASSLVALGGISR